MLWFTKPIDEITFEDVESFCKESGENVRVEYKRDITVKRHIPKIVSSFANTYGGGFLIGVEADKTKNEVIFPIQGIPQRKRNRGANTAERAYRYLSRSYPPNTTC